MVCSRQAAMGSAVSWVDDCASLPAIDGLVLDLQPQLFLDQLTELMVLRRIIRIDAEQELLIVSIEKRLSAEGGCMWPDIQTLPEVVDVSPAELSEQLALEGQLADGDPGWAETRVAEAQSCGSTHGKSSREHQQWPHREPV